MDSEKFLAHQCHVWIQCTRCVNYIQCVFPDERLRVGYLMENVSGDFPNIMAAMASIRLDNNATGKRNDSEKAVGYLLPIAEGKNKGPNKRTHGRFSKVISTVSSAKADKAGHGPSGVEYVFHSIPEYKNIGEEERIDLHQWRKENPEFLSKSGKQALFEKGTRKGKGLMSDDPDPPKTHPDSKKEKQAGCSEIASIFQEQFALHYEKEHDYTKFKSLIAGLSVNDEKDKLASIDNGTGTVKYQTS